MARSTLEKYQQTMRVLKKSTQLKTQMTKIMVLILKKNDSAIQVRVTHMFALLNEWVVACFVSVIAS